MGGGASKPSGPPVAIADAVEVQEYTDMQTAQTPGQKKVSLFCDKFAYVEQVDLKSTQKQQTLGRDKACDIVIKSQDASSKHASFQYDQENSQWTISNYSRFNSLVSGTPCVDVDEAMGSFRLAAIGLVRLGTAYVGFNINKPYSGQILIECTHGFLKDRRWASSPGAQSFKIGRGQETADIIVPNDLVTISSEHLVFENEPHVGWTVADTSTYGTTLYDDWPLKRNNRVMCVPGMRISIGKLEHKLTFVVKMRKGEC